VNKKKSKERKEEKIFQSFQCKKNLKNKKCIEIEDKEK